MVEEEHSRLDAAAQTRLEEVVDKVLELERKHCCQEYIDQNLKVLTFVAVGGVLRRNS